MLADTKVRVFTALLLGVLVIICLYLGGWYLKLLLVITSSFAGLEYLKMAKLPLYDLCSYSLAPISLGFFNWSPEESIFCALIFLCIFLLYSFKEDTGLDLKRFVVLLYPGVPTLVLMDVTLNYDLSLPFGVLLCVIMFDTASYFGGRAFGTKKLAPTISPGKTIQGALFGFLGVAFLAPTMPLMGLWPENIGGGIFKSIIIGLIIGALTLLGDLFESAVKRTHGVKDSGTLLPGHGGILDRIDGLMFASLATYFLI